MLKVTMPKEQLQTTVGSVVDPKLKPLHRRALNPKLNIPRLKNPKSQNPEYYSAGLALRHLSYCSISQILGFLRYQFGRRGALFVLCGTVGMLSIVWL